MTYNGGVRVGVSVDQALTVTAEKIAAAFENEFEFCKEHALTLSQR